jgi:glycosyltransferase involved in cell wall biosynthesis
MRVAIIQSETRFIGGIERVTEGILRHDVWKDVEWHAIFLRPGMLVDTVREFFPCDKYAIVDAGRLRNLPRTALTIARIARQLRKWKIDAVVSQGFHAQCYGGWAARLAGARNVFWCHNLVRSEHELRDPVVRLALRAPADAVISAPRSNLATLTQHYGERCPVRLVYPAHPLKSFETGDGRRVRQELGIADGAPVAAIVGRLQPWKGQDVFVRAAALVAKHMTDARFLVVGGAAMPGDESFATQLRHAARELGIADTIFFLGERRDIPDVLAAADVVVHASVEPEPFGLVITEAMSAGRAVIASRAGGPSEIIEEGKSGLLTRPGDDAELAAAMLRVLSDHRFRAELAWNGRARVESCFSFDRMTQELSSVLRDVVACREGSRSVRLPEAAAHQPSAD